MTKKLKGISAYAFFIISAFVMWLVCENIVPFYSDDVFYMSFTGKGIKHFIDMNVWHYFNYNGRSFVHIMLELVLVFKEHLYAILFPIFIIISSFVAYDLTNDNREHDRAIKEKLLSSGLAMLLFLSINYMPFDTSILWMSGGFNYVFPLFFILDIYYLSKKINGYKVYFLLPFVFLCGATTELYGMYTIGLFTLTFIFDTINHKKSIFNLVSIIISTLGYISIFFFSGTAKRVSNEVHLSLRTMIWSFFNENDPLVGRRGVAAYFLIFSFALTTLLLKRTLSEDKKRDGIAKKLIFFGGYSLFVLFLILQICNVKIFNCCILLLYVLIICLALLIAKSNYEIIKLIICGYGSYLIMAVQNSGYRNATVPFILTSIILISVLFVSTKWKNDIFMILICIVVAVMPIKNVYSSLKVSNTYVKPLYNSYETLKETGECEIDYDLFSKMPNAYWYKFIFQAIANKESYDKYDGYYEDYTGVSKDAVIHFNSKEYDIKEVRINNEYYSGPAVKMDNKLYISTNNKVYDAEYTYIGTGCYPYCVTIGIDDFCKANKLEYKENADTIEFYSIK